MDPEPLVGEVRAAGLTLHLGDGGSLTRRLMDALRDSIRTGSLAGGTALPPSRQLAAELGCSRWVVTEAYGQLVAEGYLRAVQGASTRVSDLGASAPTAPPLSLNPPMG